MLTERQKRLLDLVVESYLESGKPVGSAAIAERPEISWSASTIRSELAVLEREGFLDHPHTSAGRVPTDSGYRCYADSLLAGGSGIGGPATEVLDLTRVRAEVDEAMRETSAALARANDLMALVTAPPASTERIHRVEVLQLQPRVLAVVVIASNGAISKRVLTFRGAVDPGLVEWASSYLQERIGGLAVGARMIADRLEDPENGPAERHFLAEISDAFTVIDLRPDEALYVDGTARLLSDEHVADLPEVEELMGALERRAGLLQMLRSALDRQSVYLWIGDENPAPELRSVAVVGANYGLGYRNLGAVGIVGPKRMDYERAIGSVRAAATELSRFFETVYEG